MILVVLICGSRETCSCLPARAAANHTEGTILYSRRSFPSRFEHSDGKRHPRTAPSLCRISIGGKSVQQIIPSSTFFRFASRGDRLLATSAVVLHSKRQVWPTNRPFLVLGLDLRKEQVVDCTFLSFPHLLRGNRDRWQAPSVVVLDSKWQEHSIACHFLSSF